MPAVGLPVMLRILSAPAPREVRPSILQAFEHLDDALRLDLAELEIGARRDVGVAAGPALGERGEADHLMRLKHAVRDAQPAHE